MNKVYNIVWSEHLGKWVAASENVKNKKKKGQQRISSKAARSIAGFAVLGAGALSAGGAFAASCGVSTVSEFSSALNDSNCTEIQLNNDIQLTGNVSATFAGRENIIIDGNGYKLQRTAQGGIVFSGAEGSGASDNLQFVLKNFSEITATTQTSNPIVWVKNLNSKVDVVFENIDIMPNNMYAAMATAINSDVNSENPYSYLVIGNINNDAAFALGSFKQVAEASKIRLTGKFNLQTQNNSSGHKRVFWSNSRLEQNEVYFTKDARVSIKLTPGDNFTSGGGALNDRGSGNGYRYYFEDGAEFLLWGEQNVFGGALPASQNGINIGIQLGTYDKDTGTWGEGVKLDVASVNGAALTGNGLANLSGHSAGINNGPTGNTDVIFNLKEGSKLNVNGVGIYARKDAGNTSGIYLRSATDISAQTGIEVAHHGNGEVVIDNSGTITGVDAGIRLLSTSNNNMLVDNTGGVFNMSTGSAIKVGNSASDGNVNVNMTGGVINLSGSANGLDFSNTLSTNVHTITDAVINIEAGATGEAFVGSANNSQFTVKNIEVNLVDSIGFTDINNVTFALGDDGLTRNRVNVSGAGIGVQVDRDLSQFSNAHLDINVTNSAGIGVQVTDGVYADTITVSDGLSINALGATAIDISSASSRKLVNEGIIQGSVQFSNSGNNTIINQGTINGTLTTQGGDDSLELLADSVSEGLIDLGDGNNTVNVENGASFAQIITGNGDDSFTFNNLTEDGHTYLGAIDAGSGINTLTFNDSVQKLDVSTRLQNFATVNLDGSELTLAHHDNIAAGDIVVSNDSSLAFGESFNGTFTAQVKGAGSVEVNDSAQVTLQQSNTDFTGQWTVNEGGVLSATNNNQFGSASVQLDGTLNLNGVNSFGHTLTGETTGVLRVDTSNTTFNFASSVGDQFKGTVSLKNTQFNLSATNTSTLRQATLEAAQNSKVTVGSGSQPIGGLAFDGGTVIFGTINENNGVLTANNTIEANHIDASGTGVIQADLPTSMTPSTSGHTLMEMDEGDLLVTLASGTATGSGGNISLQDLSGTAISDTQLLDIYNEGSGTTSAKGTFDYRVTTGQSNDGLYISYGLTELELLGQGSDTLKLEASAAKNNTNANDLSAKITGNGDLLIDSETGSIISLSNSNNSYTGKTTVASGQLRLDANSALGQTSLLDIHTNAAVDLNGKTQTVQELRVENNAALNLNQGSLTVQTGGSINGNFYGQGNLTVQGGTLAISGSNQNLNAQVQIDTGATISADHISSLGQSAVTIDGTLVFDHAQGQLNNVLSGSGVLTLNNNSHVSLVHNSTAFNGTVNINALNSLTATAVSQLGDATLENAGELVLKLDAQNETLENVIHGSGLFVKEGDKTLSVGVNAFSGYTGNINIKEGELFVGNGITLGVANAGQEHSIQQDALLTGAGEVNGNVANYGTIAVTSTAGTTRALITNNTLTLNNDLSNHNRIQLFEKEDSVGNTLLVAGDYVGAGNASVHFNTVLGGDGSLTDQLVIQGHASGETALYVNNVEGEGAQTIQGVKLVDVGTSDVQAFNLANTVVAGAYEYSLYRNPTDQDWYLTSYLFGGPSTPIIRPDAGINIALQDSVIDAMTPNLSGGEESKGLFGRNIGKSKTLWAFTTGNKTRGRLKSQVDYDTNLYTLNMGADTEVNWLDESFVVGVSAHIMHSSSTAKNRFTGSRASGGFNGYSVGVYGTWYVEPEKTYSPFIDMTLRYGYFEHDAKLSNSNIKNDYSSQAWSLSAQAGYPIEITDKVILEPQAQVTYIQHYIKSYHDGTGTKTSQNLDGNIVGRVGAYIYGADESFQPYVGAHIWYDTNHSKVQYNAVALDSDKRGAIYDARVGLKSQLGNNLSIWGEVNGRAGRHHYRNWGASAGIRYAW